MGRGSCLFLFISLPSTFLPVLSLKPLSIAECGEGVTLAYLSNASCYWHAHCPLFLAIAYQSKAIWERLSSFGSFLWLYLLLSGGCDRPSLAVLWCGWWLASLSCPQGSFPSHIPSRSSIHPMAFSCWGQLITKCPHPLVGWWWWSQKYEVRLRLQSQQGEFRFTYPSCMGTPTASCALCLGCPLPSSLSSHPSNIRCSPSLMDQQLWGKCSSPIPNSVSCEMGRFWYR